MEKNNNQNYGNCIVATHASDIMGPPDHLVRFLKDKSNYLLFVHFPLATIDVVRPEYKLYFEGKLIEEGKSKFMVRPFVLNYPKDILFTIFWSLRISARHKIKFETFIGCNNLLTIAGAILKRLSRIKHLIFFSVDYSDKRFGNKFLNNIYLWIDKQAARKASFVWSNTNRTREIRRKQGVKENSNLLVPNGVFLEDIKDYPQEGDKNIVKFEYHGYLAESKGIQYFIKALDKSGHTNYLFDIIGHGTYEPELKKLISKPKYKDRIKFLGRKSNKEVLSFLKKYDVCVNLINSKEDYLRYCDPLKIKEALGAGLVVLISDLPEIAQRIKNENLGFVVSNGEDVKAITHVVKEILEDPKKLQEYKDSLKSKREEFDWNFIFTNALNHLI